MMNKGIRLYGYQQEMRERIESEFHSHRSVMGQMPTGTGKTYLLAAIVLDYIEQTGRQVWIVAHRRELVDQINNTIRRWGENLIDVDNAQDFERDVPCTGVLHPMAATPHRRDTARARACCY